MCYIDKINCELTVVVIESGGGGGGVPILACAGKRSIMYPHHFFQCRAGIDGNILTVNQIWIPSHYWLILSRGQDLTTRFGDQHCMLKLSASFSIRGYRSPVVTPGVIPSRAQIDHWFNCKNMPHLYRTFGFILVIMGYCKQQRRQKSDRTS